MRNLGKNLGPLLDGSGPIAVITDTNVGPLWLERVRGSVPALRDALTVTVPAEHKDLETLTEVWHKLSDGGMTRGGTVVNLGGGTVTDLGGFAASTFKRGVRFVNVPTTLLGMADASVGGKTGIDFNGLKNEIGTFAMPEAVVADAMFLSTLPPLEILSGFAEMLKTGLIADKELYYALLRLESPVDASPEEMTPLIERTIAIKERVTASDPTEKGLRKILNFGHTAGHAFESRLATTHHPVPHGIAVAWGLLTELILSHLELGLDSSALYPYARLLKELYPAFPFSCGRYEPLIALMNHDKKNVSPGLLNFTLLREIGEAEFDCLIGEDKVKEALDITLELSGR